jgi:hypothetical protein
LDDYDEMLGVEELLIAKLTAESEVDGHDFGGGGTNIFVATDDPKSTELSVYPSQREKQILSCHDETRFDCR